MDDALIPLVIFLLIAGALSMWPQLIPWLQRYVGLLPVMALSGLVGIFVSFYFFDYNLFHGIVFTVGVGILLYMLARFLFPNSRFLNMSLEGTILEKKKK